MSNMKRNIGIGIAIIIALIIILFGAMAIEVNGEKIAQNTYVNGVNIGGLTKDEVKQKLKKEFSVEKIELVYNDKVWNLDAKDIDASYNIDSTVEKAYGLNRSNNFFNDFNKTIQSHFGKKSNLVVELNYNQDELKKQLETLAEEIDVDVKDASININGSSISVEEDNDGLKLNVEESVKNIVKELENSNYKIQLSVEVVEPSIKSEELNEVDTLLGTYSTKFDSSVSGRTTNIKLATNRTSNVLLMPGDTFSYNEHTLRRTAANGYKDAPVIVQGVIQEGIGGGVCQVSSTLYNTVLYAGLEIVNVKNHSIPSSYVEKGRDAVVSDGSLDFIFKNNLKYPVYVKNYVSGNTITCQIYGSSKDKQSIQISTSVDGVSVAPVKKVDDPTLLKGEEKQLEKGRDGYTVSTYRIYKDSDGNVIKKEKVATSYYPKKQGVIAVGTKEEVVVPEEQPPVTEQPPTEQPPVTEPPVTEQPPVTETPPVTEQPAQDGTVIQ